MRPIRARNLVIHRNSSRPKRELASDHRDCVARPPKRRRFAGSRWQSPSEPERQMKMLHYANALALALGTVTLASGQVATQAKAPLTPEQMAVHLLAKRPLSFATAKL